MLPNARKKKWSLIVSTSPGVAVFTLGANDDGDVKKGEREGAGSSVVYFSIGRDSLKTSLSIKRRNVLKTHIL